MTASHLEFYATHAISPVRQDITNWQRHVERRHALSMQLGIAPAMLRGRRVVEVGPGGGYNALYTASLSPSEYVLIEGNPAGAAELQENFAKYKVTCTYKVLEQPLESFESDETFDFAICEGVLSGVPNPEQILSKLVELTASGGVLTITCVDHASHFPETIRRLFAQILINAEHSIDDAVKIIDPAMRPHLESLGGMNRRYDDWIIDNLLHPGSIIPLINLPEAVAVLAQDFQFLSSSPRFTQDWRWYKSLVGEEFDFNINAITSYWKNMHSLLDCRFVFPEREEVQNQHLYDSFTEARSFVKRYEETRDTVWIERFTHVMMEIILDVRSFSPEIGQAFTEVVELLQKPNLSASDVANASAFGPLFGRGQQYISFVKV